MWHKSLNCLPHTLTRETGSKCSSFSSGETYDASFCVDMREHKALLLTVSAVRHRTPQVLVHTEKIRSVQTSAIFLQHFSMKQPLKKYAKVSMTLVVSDFASYE